MKNKMNLPFKILAGVLAITLIGFILLVTNAFVGNPVSQIMANKAIKQYVEKNYPSMNLEIGKASYEFKEGSYIGMAKSKTSIDTKFGVFYKNGKVQRDAYESNVLSMFNTSIRLSDEYSTIAKNIITKELGYADNTTMVFSKSESGKSEESMGNLTLDMKFDKKLFIDPQVVIRLDLPDNSLDVITNILTVSHKAFLYNDCNFDTYGLYAQNGDRYYADVTGVTPADIESGKLRSLLEKAKSNRSGSGMSVLIKEKK